MKLSATPDSFSDYWRKIFPVIALSFIVLALMAGFYLLFGFYYETNDEMQMELSFRGIIMPVGFWDLYYWHRLSGWLLSSLYQFSHDFPWYGWSLYFLLYLSLVNFFVGFYYLFSGKKTWLIVLFMFFFIFSEHLLTLNFLRVTILLTTSAIFLFMVICSRLENHSQQRYRWLLYVLVTFLLGYQIRPEGGMLIAGFSLPFLFFLYRLSDKVRKPIWMLLAVIVLTISGIFVFNQFVKNENFEKDHQIIPYIQYLHNIPGSVSVNNPIDRLRLEVATSGFFCDDQLVSEDFLKTHLPKYSLFLFDRIRFSEFFADGVHILKIFFKNNLPLALASGFWIISLFVIGVRHRDYSFLFNVAAANVVFWIGLIALSITYKMPNRLLSPLLLMQFFMNILFFISIREKGYSIQLSKKTLVVLSVLIFFSVSAYSYRQYKKMLWYKERCRINTETLEKVEEQTKNTIFLFSKEAISLFNGIDALKGSPLRSRDKYIAWGWTNWYSDFKEQLKRIGNSTYFQGALIKGVASKPHILLASEKDAALLEAHLRFYNPGIQLKPVSFVYVEEKTYNQKIRSYQIKLSPE